MKILFQLFILLTVVFTSVPAWAKMSPDEKVSKGKSIAFNRKKGNCLACHKISGGELTGTVGPPLIFMKERFPNRQDLRVRIYDATRVNPMTIMPPFGQHGILSEKEIELVTDFVHSL